MKEKIIKIIKKLALLSIISVFILGFAALSTYGDNKKIQYLENLNYDVVAYENGDIKITETWDIRVRNTNTLFKTFDLNPYKYSQITDVEVKEIKNNNSKKFTRIYEEMYHVTQDSYYALKNRKGEFEIAWGIGMDNKSGRKKYQISYIVKDALTDYEDCQELYWQFLAQGENNVSAKKVTGTITLPKDVKNLDNLKVWGHGQLNGEINKINAHQVQFKLNDLRAFARLEIRIVTQEDMFNISAPNKIKNYNGMPSILREENRWADEANEQSKVFTTTRIILLAIYITIMFIYAIKIFKINKYKNKEQYKVEKIEYFRDIPREKDATPAEAAYLYKFNKSRLDTATVQQDAVAATILDLCLKRKITLRTDENAAYIKIVAEAEDLKKDEKQIYDLLKNVGGKEEFEVGELNEYANREYNRYSTKINNLVNGARESLYNQKLIDKSEEKQYRKYNNSKGKSKLLLNTYIVAILTQIYACIPIFKTAIDVTFGAYTVPTIIKLILIFLPFVCELLYYYKIQDSVKNKIAVLTEDGAIEQEQWKGLVRYITNFSFFDEKVIPDLIIWEKYLVFATALGKADRVIEQMKAFYPEVFVKEYWENEETSNLYPVLNFSVNPIYHMHVNSYNDNPITYLGSGIDRAYHTSVTEIAKHSSSSRWRRRRWLLRRRRRPEVAGRPEWEADN